MGLSITPVLQPPLWPQTELAPPGRVQRPSSLSSIGNTLTAWCQGHPLPPLPLCLGTLIPPHYPLDPSMPHGAVWSCPQVASQCGKAWDSPPQPSPPPAHPGTSVAVGIELGGRVREAGAVGELVHGPHPWLVPAALLAWDADGVADAAIGQPARVALVQPTLPRQVQLARGGQHGPVTLALLPGPLGGEPPRRGDVKHFPCRGESSPVRVGQQPAGCCRGWVA